MTLTVGVLATGCLIARSTTVEVSGKRVTPEMERQIKEGETTVEWLVALLGEPTEREPAGERREILSYESVVTKEKESGVFLLYVGEKTVKKKVVSRFEFEDGVLARYWTD